MIKKGSMDNNMDLVTQSRFIFFDGAKFKIYNLRKVYHEQ